MTAAMEEEMTAMVYELPRFYTQPLLKCGWRFPLLTDSIQSSGRGGNTGRSGGSDTYGVRFPWSMLSHC
jgi:hypothetical protein